MMMGAAGRVLLLPSSSQSQGQQEYHRRQSRRVYVVTEEQRGLITTKWEELYSDIHVGIAIGIKKGETRNEKEGRPLR